MTWQAAGSAANDEGVSPPVVLVADDDPTSRLLVGAALEGYVAAIVEAENGAVAAEALDHGSFDLAILDLDMPVMDGFGVIAKARADSATLHLPIIVVTGRDDVLAIERAFALGATSFLCKPINWNVFRHQVSYVLRVARTERSLRVAKEKAERLAVLREAALAALADLPDALAGTEIPVAPMRDAVRERLASTAAIVDGSAVFQPRTLDVSEIAGAALEKVEALFGTAARRRIAAACDAGTELSCDPAMAVEAVAAALESALAASAPGGSVRLSVVSAPPDRIRFEVHDDGPAIPEHLLDARFETLADSRTPGGRYGLALAAARTVIDRHGGHFGIFSEPGAGTEVFLSFPGGGTSSCQGERSANAKAQIS